MRDCNHNIHCRIRKGNSNVSINSLGSKGKSFEKDGLVRTTLMEPEDSPRYRCEEK